MRSGHYQRDIHSRQQLPLLLLATQFSSLIVCASVLEQNCCSEVLAISVVLKRLFTALNEKCTDGTESLQLHCGRLSEVNVCNGCA